MKQEDKIQEIVIDASKGVLGRIASIAAKQSLLGKKVIIVNCNEALVTGNKKSIVEEYNLARRRGGSSLNGPFFPKHTERVMKRTIRGMLNYHQKRGLDAFNRIMCYPNVPKEYENVKKLMLARELKTKSMNLSDLSKVI